MKQNELIKKISEVVSAIFNPGILAIVILFVAIARSNMPADVAIGWYVSALVLNCIIPGMVYMFFTSRGFVFDDTLHHKDVHRERVGLFGSFLAVTAIELLMMVMTGQFYQPLFAVLVGGIGAIIIAGAISYFWKMSMHSSMVTFFTLMIVYIFGWSWWPIFLLIPLVWWSRLILYRHTIWQLLGGAIFSIALVSIVYTVFKVI